MRFRGAEAQLHRVRRERLVALLVRLIKELALTQAEIEALPDNYAAATKVHGLPSLFEPGGEWLEVRWLLFRMHDHAADYRRAARVFIRPASPPASATAFLEELLQAHGVPRQLDAVALVVQNLLIRDDGKVVPSPLTYQVQLRRFIRDDDGELVRTELAQYELSRRHLLADPESGGLAGLGEAAPSYLPGSGNDYGFASNQHRREGAEEPILVSLRTRCISCHDRDVRTVFTFAFHSPRPPPPVMQLDPSGNDHAHYVAQHKMEQEDFKALVWLWSTEQR